MDGQCDKLANVVGNLLTTLATVDVPRRNLCPEFREKLQREVTLFLEIRDTRIAL